MRKLKHLLILLVVIVLTLTVTGCSKKKDDKSNEKGENQGAQSEAADNIEVVLKDDITVLSKDMANSISKEIKEIMTSTQEGVHRLENFTITFDRQTSKDDGIYLDATVDVDWITLRKPEETPVIIGMNQALEELETEEEKKKAEEIISGFIVNMDAVNTVERIPSYLKIRFDKEDQTKYELLVAETWDEEDSVLHPMKEYYEENYKENWDEKVKLGKDTLLENME